MNAPLRQLTSGRLWALALGAGLLWAAAFPKVDQGWLGWLVPGLILALALQVRRGRDAFRVGFHAGFAFHGSSMCWMFLMPYPVHGALWWFGMVIAQSFYPAFWCWLAWRTCPGSKARGHGVSSRPWDALWTAAWGSRAWWALGCGVVWAATEMLAARWWTGFPWDLLGMTQARVLPLLQIASFTGVYGVSCLVAWASVALLCAVGVALVRGRSWRVWLPELAAPAAALALALGYGVLKLAQPPATRGVLRVALVQPNIPYRDSWNLAEKTNHFERLMALSREALQAKPDLLVWPESCLPGLLARNAFLQTNIAALVQAGNAWMILGVDDYGPKASPKHAGDVQWYNTSFLIAPNGDLRARYHKRHLVPFTEYMPLTRWLPILKRFQPADTVLASGPGPVKFQIERPPAACAVLICLEDIFPHLAREHVREDIDFLLNETNDGWFRESAQQWQHARSALFRTVENGLPLVRCANNGLTCWIDAQGRMHEVYFPGSDNIHQAGWKLAQVPLPAQPRRLTFYTRHGDVFGWSCLAVLLVLLGASLGMAWKRRAQGGRG